MFYWNFHLNPIPSKEDMVKRAKKLAQITHEHNADFTMVGGAA